MEYPHFAKPESTFNKRQTFCDFYMPDVEYEKLIKLFPNGCESGWISDYTIFYKGKSIVNWVYDNTKPMSEERDSVFASLKELHESNQSSLWEWHDLLHMGYHPVFDGNLNIACCSGKIKPNKHTSIILLGKVPAKVMSLWKKLSEEYIKPAQEIIANNFEK